LLEAPDNFIDLIDGTTAAVIIGDRALEKYESFPYKYDLAEAWVSYTGKPFVFATWVSNKTLDHDFIQSFNEANAFGVEHINEVIQTLEPSNFSYNLYTYFTKNISYYLDAPKIDAMSLFLIQL
jgi:chorismate dehydratase